MPKILLLALSLLLTSPVAGAAAALPVIVEAEPNNSPEEAFVFTAPGVLSGQLPAFDQDAYLWRISDAQAQQQWNLSLQGIPGALTGVSIMRVQYGPDPNMEGEDAPEVITGYDKLLTFGIRDGSRPVTRRNLYLPAGEFVVGVFGVGQSAGFRPPGKGALEAGMDGLDSPEARAAAESGAHAYRVNIESASSPLISRPVENEARDKATALRLGSTFASLANGEGWYRFTLDESAAASRWSISGELMIENLGRIALHNGAEEALANDTTDANGHYRLPNLVLQAGVYFLQITDKAEFPAPRSVRVIASGAVTDASEQEPNDTWPLANILQWSDTYSANVDKKAEKDYFRFTVTTGQQDEVFDLVLDSPILENVQFCLLDDNWGTRSCKSGKPPLRLDTLSLEAGEHGLLVSRANAEGAYTLVKSVTGSVQPGIEQEPNNITADASVFGPRNLIKGTLPAGDQDYFTLLVTDEPQLWRLQAIGADLHDLTYYPAHGNTAETVRAKSGSRRLRLDNLFLLPGKHQFRLNGKKDTKYVLRALPLGPPSPHTERESNSSRNRAQPIALGGHVIGIIAEESDADYYRFHVPSRQPVQLQLKAPPETVFGAQLYWDGGTLKQYNRIRSDNPLDEALLLNPGDYYLWVWASPASEIEYELHVSGGELRGSDFEPNDDVNFATRLPDTRIIEGSIGASRARTDLYALPTVTQPTVLTLSGDKDDSIYFQLVGEDARELAPFATQENGAATTMLPANTPTFLNVYYGPGNYRLLVDLAEGATPPPAQTPLDMGITLSGEQTTVAAYRELAQGVALQANLENHSDASVTLSLAATTSNDKWQPQVMEQVTLAPQERASVPVTVKVAPDVWPDQPVTLRLTASDASNRVAAASLALNAERLATSVNPALEFGLPEELLGTINVAAARLGAEMITSEGSGLDSLNDGMTPIGYYFQTKRATPLAPGTVQPVIDLAGDTEVQVAGFSFHPFGLQDGQPAQRNATRVAVELSVDGVNFTRVIDVPLTSHNEQQAFSLAKPVAAKFAKLVLLDSYDRYLIALGEFKVFATANSVEDDVKTVNIALPTHGGHVVSMQPAQPTQSHTMTIITPEQSGTSFRTRSGNSYAWVIGFNQNRAALLRSLRWQDADNLGAQRFLETDVHVSTQSALGPWRKVATWTLQQGQQNELELPEPTWARFLRFVARTEQPDGGWVYAPDQISVFEAQDHGSVIAAWGQNKSTGPMESALPPVLPAPLARPQNTTRASARALGAEPEDTNVRLGEYDNWYRVTVAPGENHLAVSLRGYPTIEATAELQDAGGDTMGWTSREVLVDRAAYEAWVEPGDYWIKVVEPPRSVVFTWDTSGSTAGVRPIIRQAMMRYVQDLQPELDEAHMLPFGGGFLSQRWLSQPYMLQSVLNDYNGAGDSSAAEAALVQAANKLRNREGKKIIVVITDAATSADGMLWQTLDEVRPRIIALGVSSKGAFSSNPRREQALLQDWAFSSGGYYEYVENVGAVGRAFDRASTRIRQPAAYRITAATGFSEKPAPGSLQVLLQPSATADMTVQAPAVEVILDASGSMLQRLDGKRRYLIAREVLQDMVQNSLPEGALFGLRVFGHKEAGSCRTDLEIPVAPLDKALVTTKIRAITPKNLAKTPIADSIAAVAGDLRGNEGPKTVIVITDGEETCGGDVPAALEKLGKSGIDAVVNIVGFAIDDEALEARFRAWASLGGGEYQHASDQALLASSVQDLVKLRFRVEDNDGDMYGPYPAGDEAIELSAGEYTVHLGDGKRRKVKISPGSKTTVKVAYNQAR